MQISKPVVGAATALVAAATTACVLAGTAGSASGGAAPPDPTSFGQPKQNPYYPLVPGTVTHFRGTDDGEVFHEKVTITHRTRRIQGVRATVVLDVLRRADGTVAEKTHDWYAADNAGNVWYFGEDTATYRPDGTVGSHGGSWQSGKHGAKAGLIMPASPGATDAYRQEYWHGRAEDQGWVVSSHEIKRVPAGKYHDVVRTYEWSRLEKNVVGLKFYAPGVGTIIDRELGGEDFVLTSVSQNGG